MGDGIDTFNLPDLRGEFIRGLDSGRNLGTAQSGGVQDHVHEGIYVGQQGSGLMCIIK